jgi:DNA-directed RNA polymerase specialized sigma24 family protein
MSSLTPTDPFSLSPQSTPPSSIETTRWSMIRRAVGQDEVARLKALTDLCEKYRRPLLKSAQWNFRLNPDDAEELVQGFLVWLIDPAHLSRADSEKGKLRTFLMFALRSYRSHQLEKAQAQRRGGNAPHVPLEYAPLGALGAEDADIGTRLDREWAKTAFGHALDRVSEAYAGRGKGPLFALLKDFLLQAGESSSPLAEVAKAAGLEAGAFSVELHRFRKRLKEAFQKEVMDTVDSMEEALLEMNYLMKLLSL